MSSINLNPAARIGITPQTPKTRRPETQTVEERQLIERLFGKPIPDVKTAKPIQTATGDNADDDFAPNLGRHLDVLA